MTEWFTNPESWLALSTLILLEIVLGIDNLIFISITTAKLPHHLREKARIIGLFLAMLTRIGLLFIITWIITLTAPILFDLSGRDIFLLCGGAFLCYKGITEIKDLSFDPNEHNTSKPQKKSSFILILIEIALLDIVFSLDSIITAVGMLESLKISHQAMLALAIIAIAITVIIMMFVSGYIARFIHAHPNIKLLALCFLILIGIVLICDSLGFHIPKSYVYVTLAFSLAVEIIRLIKQK